MSEDEATRALVREVGRRSVERLGDGLTRTVAEASALYRWLLTMLLLINGAGLCLSIAARAAIGPGLFGQVVLFFFGGAMAAILAALVSMALTLPASASIRKAITHWTDVAVSGELSAPALVSARQVKWMGLVWLVLTSLVVLVSLALFLTGADRLATRFAILPKAAVEASAPEPVPQASFSNVAHPLVQSNEAAGPPATPAAQPSAMPTPRAAATITSRPRQTPRAAPSGKSTPRQTPTPQPSKPSRPVTAPAAASPAATPSASSVAPPPVSTTP